MAMLICNITIYRDFSKCSKFGIYPKNEFFALETATFIKFAALLIKKQPSSLPYTLENMITLLHRATCIITI
jgi:hypothetical protein